MMNFFINDVFFFFPEAVPGKRIFGRQCIRKRELSDIILHVREDMKLFWYITSHGREQPERPINPDKPAEVVSTGYFLYHGVL